MARGGPVPRPRHVPQRTCVACRQGKPKREMVRIVRTVEGRVELDPSGKKSGRGAYLCSDPDCWTAALKRGVLPRALKIDAIPEGDLGALNAYAQQLTSTTA